MMKDTKKESAEQSELGLTLEELIRRGARALIQKAIEVEVRELLADYENVKMLGGQKAVVRNGYLPERQVLTAVGPVGRAPPRRASWRATASSASPLRTRPRARTTTCSHR